jgi:hypothetical protein
VPRGQGKKCGRLKVSNVATATINAGDLGTSLLIYTAWGTGLVEAPQAGLAEAHNANQPAVDRDSGAAHAGGSARCRVWETPLIVQFPGMHPSGTGRVFRGNPARTKAAFAGATVTSRGSSGLRPPPGAGLVNVVGANFASRGVGNALTNADGYG